MLFKACLEFILKGRIIMDSYRRFQLETYKLNHCISLTVGHNHGSSLYIKGIY